MSELKSANKHINIEIKAKSSDQEKIRIILKERNADFVGTDFQTDIYFNIGNGRIKLREGNIENHLIYYERENKESPKQSNVILYKSEQGTSLKNILSLSLGILTEVKKQREIYFIDNVKFHLDKIDNLGTFIEIEAIDKTGIVGKEKLHEQCSYYMNLFEIKKEDLISVSYSDLLLSQ